MDSIRLDVNDAVLRERFLAQTVPRAVSTLTPDAIPQWGHMRAQEMIEHLLWAVELSTGKAEVSCSTPPADLPRFRQFLTSNRPAPKDFMNPALRAGLPALRFEGLDRARSAFGAELSDFLRDGQLIHRRFVHPIFGELSHEEWHVVHYKHCHHHLLQFGLIEPPWSVP